MKPMKIHKIYETKQNYIPKANDMTGKQRKKKKRPRITQSVSQKKV
jgi:hypothetical protein